MLKKLSLILLLLFCASPLMAQEEENNGNFFFYQGGVGIADSILEEKGDGGMSLYSSAKIVLGSHIIGLRGIWYIDWASIFTIGEESEGVNEISEYALLYGYAIPADFGLFYLAGGPSYIKVKWEGSAFMPDSDKYGKTWGFAVEAGIFITAKILGIGITGFVDFNSEQKFYGAAFTVLVGKLF